ncbi:uncharacterized protein B0T23DRAFT_122577 [Neurospora hispaniola]|uniref:Uncharacterized protein n=1 Tax=Neurospora hispaniola TaxID=588809 RepID=A0AAJ0IAG7_9PEZI|nr:hypothetical protein B0T23DRAFT_122577 [Neurospora hispaniola]
MPSDNDRDSHAAMYILHQGSIGLMRRGRVQPQRVKMTRNHQIRPGIRKTTKSIFPRQDRPFLLLAWMNASVMHKSDHASRTLNVSSHAFANHFIAKKLLLPTLSPCEKDHQPSAQKGRFVSRPQYQNLFNGPDSEASPDEALASRASSEIRYPRIDT